MAVGKKVVEDAAQAAEKVTKNAIKEAGETASKAVAKEGKASAQEVAEVINKIDKEASANMYKNAINVEKDFELPKFTFEKNVESAINGAERVGKEKDYKRFLHVPAIEDIADPAIAKEANDFANLYENSANPINVDKGYAKGFGTVGFENIKPGSAEEKRILNQGAASLNKKDGVKDFYQKTTPNSEYSGKVKSPEQSSNLKDQHKNTISKKDMTQKILNNKFIKTAAGVGVGIGIWNTVFGSNKGQQSNAQLYGQQQY